MSKMLFLGVEGSGKSTLTAAFVAYLSKHAEWGWSLRPENKEAFAFSSQMIPKFVAGELPGQTARFRRLEWSLCYENEPYVSLEILDYPGEVYRLAFLDPEDDPNPSSLAARQRSYENEIKELMGYLVRADQIFLLFNLNDSKDLGTNNDNLDAVWVTVSALKILSRLEAKPEVSLLLTQADRFASELADEGEAKRILGKYVPVITQHFNDLNATFISALDSENESFGIKSLFGSILRYSQVYKLAFPKWKEWIESACSGMECKNDSVQKSAKAFACISDEASFVAGSNEEWEEFFKVREYVKEIEHSDIKSSEKVKKLSEFEERIELAIAKKYVRIRLEFIKKDSDDMQAGLLVLIFAVILFVVLVTSGLYIGNASR